MQLKIVKNTELGIDEEMELQKAVELVAWRPKVGKITQTGRKVYNVLMYLAQRKMYEAKYAGMPVPITFSAPLSTILDPIRSGSSNPATAVQAYLQEMLKVTVEFGSVDRGKEDWLGFNLLAQASIKKEDKAVKSSPVTVSWQFAEAIREHLLLEERLGKKRMYAQINIYQLAKLHTYESIALYEIVSRYRDSDGKRTAAKEPDWWVTVLSNTPKKVDPDTGLPVYRDWPRFKDAKIKAAVADINNLTDLTVTLEEEKPGKSILKVWFEIRKKTLAEMGLDAPRDALLPALSEELAKQALKFQINLGYLQGLIQDGYSEVSLLTAFAKISGRKTSLDSIQSIKGYFKAVLEEVASQIGSQTILPPAKSPANNLPIAQSHKEEMRTQARIELLGQTLDQQREYAMHALSVLKQNGLANSSVVLKVSSGNWQSAPLVLAKMIEIYAVERFGDQWVQTKNGS